MDNRLSRHRPGKLDEQADIEEARLVLPGIQALFGFQLIAVFNERFKELTKDEQLPSSSYGSPHGYLLGLLVITDLCTTMGWPKSPSLRPEVRRELELQGVDAARS